MHEPGAHTFAPPRPIPLTREHVDGFADTIYTMERRCLDAECGAAAPTKKIKAPAFIVRKAEHVGLVELSEEHRRLARILARKWRPGSEWMPLRGARTEIQPLPAWRADALLEDLCRMGVVELKLSPNRVPTHYRVAAQDHLTEIGKPGVASRLAKAKEDASKILGGAAGAEPDMVRRLLEGPEADSWPPSALLAAAAVARQAIERRIVPMRVASTRWLAGRVAEVSASKGIEHHQHRLETFFGKPLLDLGLRPHEPLVTIGGRGVLLDSPVVDLAQHFPFLAFPATRLSRLSGLLPPTEGIVFIENLNVFEAACYGEIPEFRGALYVYTGGMVGEAEAWFARQAATAGARARCWFDLDGEGILAARLIREWTKQACEAYRMAPQEVQRATRVEPLEGPKLATVERLAGDGGYLSDLAAALLSRRVWVEQEALLIEDG